MIAQSVDGRIYVVDDQSKNGPSVARREHCGEYHTLKWHQLEVGDILRLGDIKVIIVDKDGNCPIQVNQCADLVRFALQIYGSENRVCDCLKVPRTLWRKICERLEVSV